MNNRSEHWEKIYQSKSPTEVSWYQPEARLSVELIRYVAPGLDAPIIDVGGRVDARRRPPRRGVP